MRHPPLSANHGAHMVKRASRRPDIVPRDRLPFLLVPDGPTPVRRSPAETTSGTTRESCAPGDNSGQCEKYASSTTTAVLPVVLGAVIPIVCAIIILFFLHRRHVKKLRSEDANDKHKSLDFGMDVVESAPGSRPMEEADKSHRKGGKGVSLDIGHPYLLPPGLHNSRESLHSLSRSIVGDDDKYRHASSFLQGDNASLRSHPRGPQDDASSFAGSTRHALGDDMNQGLLRNAQRMSRSSPPLYRTQPDDSRAQSPVSPDEDHGLEMKFPRALSPTGPTPGAPDHGGAEHAQGNKSPEPVNFPLQDPLPSHLDPSPTQPNLGPTHTSPPAIQTPRISLPLSDGASDYGDGRKSDAVIPAVNVLAAADDVKHDESSQYPKLPPEPSYDLNRGLDTRRLTLGLRPLPPEDPSDNPEQRANRIRSFYKEYFDESKPAKEEYYEDYGPEVYGDALSYDPATGEYYGGVIPPFAEPVNRRAMTPPPRAPPRFQGGARHMATNSAGGGFRAPGPRAFSSASGRLPGARGPRKPMPPPSPLSVLPTPHMLKDDAIMTAIDYAPGKNIKDQREGRPETPRGGLRPFSPMAIAHTPLVSVFDELSAIPSPHALRKSGTYTSLDFAPPPRFKNTDTASDAGSIRSNRTGISTAHLTNIRAGAYRISRLPADTVGTKDDIMSSLRPTWDMRQQ